MNPYPEHTPITAKRHLSACVGRYTWAFRHRGQLADAVVAHMTTNALIAVYVLTHHAWSLWE